MRGPGPAQFVPVFILNFGRCLFNPEAKIWAGKNIPSAAAGASSAKRRVKQLHVLAIVFVVAWKHGGHSWVPSNKVGGLGYPSMVEPPHEDPPRPSFFARVDER